MAYAAGRTDSWKRGSRPGSGAPRETSRASASTPASHSRPKNSVAGTSVVKPTSGEMPNRSPRSPSASCPRSPREREKVWRAERASARSATSHSTAILAAHPASSPARAIPRCRSGRRKPAARTRAPVSVTDSGITVSSASDSASPPAFPESSIVPPTAVTTVAATTRGKALSGRSAAPAAHSPRAATTPMATSAASTVTRACTQPWPATAGREGA